MLFRKSTDWNLLAKFMAGETNDGETNRVRSWADKSPENKALLDSIKSDWQKMDIIDKRFDVDQAWSKLHGRIAGVEDNKPEISPVVPRRLIRSFSVPVRIAASLLLLAILGTAVVTTVDRLQQITVTTAGTEKGRIISLPDGSKVHLNSDSRISYSKRFAKNNRNISLTGEAYFEVTPDKQNPFRIIAGSAAVKVVGTTFNVNSRKSGDRVEVYVETGVVELADIGEDARGVLLQPGNIGIVDDNNVSVQRARNANSLAWMTGTLTFVDTPLTEVIELLNNVYNVNITVKGNDIDTIRINGSYQGDPLDDILQVISQHNPELSIAKSDDTFYLSQ